MTQYNRSGFGLVEALITVVIVGIGFAALVQLTTTSMKSQNTVKNSIDFDLLASSIGQMLTNPGACIKPLRDASDNPLVYDGTTSVPVNRIYLGTGVLATLNAVMSGGLTITSMALQPAVVPSTSVTYSGITYTRQITILSIQAKKGESFGGPTLNRSFVMSLDTDPVSKQILSCNHPVSPIAVISPPLSIFCASSSASHPGCVHLADDTPYPVTLPPSVPDFVTRVHLRFSCSEVYSLSVVEGQPFPVLNPGDPNNSTWGNYLATNRMMNPCLAHNDTYDISTQIMPVGPTRTFQVLFHEDDPPTYEFQVSIVGWE